MLYDVFERREGFLSFSAVVSLPAEAGLGDSSEGLSGVDISGATWSEGEGIWPRRTEPRRESGLWRKEALGWSAAVWVANMSISIAPAMVERGEACCEGRQ
jgi:hypothetical protein